MPLMIPEGDFRQRLHQPPVLIETALSTKAVGEDRLLRSMKKCNHCNPPDRIGSPVLPQGEWHSRYAFIGRNPGMQEAFHSQPFYPKAPGGRTLERYLLTLGIQRKECYITNAVLCNFRSDRPPRAAELAACSSYKKYEFYLLEKAEFVFLLGNDATRAVLMLDHPSIVRSYGMAYKDKNGRLYFPILHPGSVLRAQASLVKIVYEHLLYIRKAYIEGNKE